MKNRLTNTLNRLWKLELAFALVLIAGAVIGWLVTGGRTIGGYTLLAATCASGVLACGAHYWRSKRVIGQPTSRTALQLYYLVGLAATVAFPITVGVGVYNETIQRAMPDALIAVPIYLFALVSFLHHGLSKLVRSADDQLGRTRRRQVSARWMRELNRAERREKSSS